MVHHIATKEDLENQLAQAGTKLVVIDFFASWCGPCRAIAPKFEVLPETFPDVVFLKINVDELEEVAESYGIDVMPTFIFIKNGKKVGSLSGANEGKLKNLITQYGAQ